MCQKNYKGIFYINANNLTFFILFNITIWQFILSCYISPRHRKSLVACNRFLFPWDINMRLHTCKNPFFVHYHGGKKGTKLGSWQTVSHVWRKKSLIFARKYWAYCQPHTVRKMVKVFGEEIKIYVCLKKAICVAMILSVSGFRFYGNWSGKLSPHVQT